MANPWKVLLGSIGFCTLAGATASDVLGFVYEVEGTSMQPVLNPRYGRDRRDVVYLNKFAARKYNLERGEIVSLINPRDPDEWLIKRIIGLPGDDIRTLTYKNRYVKIPEGHIWIEGDNRSSVDSNLYGPVAMALVIAKCSYIVWPVSRWQKLEQNYPEHRVNCKHVSPLTLSEDENIQNHLEET